MNLAVLFQNNMICAVNMKFKVPRKYLTKKTIHYFKKYISNLICKFLNKYLQYKRNIE